METAQTVTAKASYVDWPAVFAGAVLASSISFVLLTAGASIGLSMVSAETESHDVAAIYFATFWAIAVPIGSLLAGGYVAGRMRAAWTESALEVDFRDGIHGALVWGISVLFGTLLAFAAAGAAGRLAASVASGAASAVEVSAPAVATLLQAQPGPNRAALSAEQQSVVSGILIRSARSGEISQSDRTYLNQTVAQVTGAPVAEAEKRVNEAYATTVEAVERARKATVAAGLITATAMLMGLAAAWFAAQSGGNHRDNERPARFFTVGTGRS